MDKLLFSTPFIDLLQRDDYIFIREVRAEGILIAILPFRLQGEGYPRYLARWEICPAHSPYPELCAITGGLEVGETIENCACNELYEESGYKITVEELINLGTVRPSKSADYISKIRC